MIIVEIAYAQAAYQRLVELEVPSGTTAREAAVLSGLDEYFPELDLQANPIGVFGEKVADETVLKSGDRVELYRDLLFDPMELRRQKARASTDSKGIKRKPS